MAHYLVEEDQIACPPIVPGNHTHSLSRYLTKYKLPIQKFIDNEIELNDLESVNETYFKGLCDDLQLNTVQIIRFKKLIQELNESKTNIESKQNIQNKFKNIEHQITHSIDRLIIELNNRKNDLLNQLDTIRQHKLKTLSNIHTDTDTINIQYITDEITLKQNIHTFGIIDDTPHYIKCPVISCIAYADSIRVYIENQNNYPFSIEIKELNTNDAHNCIVIQNTNIIQNLKPFTPYSIRARFHITSHLFSSYSKQMEVMTKLDLGWNIKQHIKNKYVEVLDSYKLFCGSKCGTVCVVAEPILSGVYLKSVTFEFIFEAFCQTSMFGFIKTPMYQTMNGYWKQKLIAMNKYGYILETMDGLKTVHRYKGGVDTEKSYFSNPGILLSKIIKSGDRFIFDVDFDECECNVYINKCDKSRKIVTKSRNVTWENIPNEIVPVYGHSVGSRFIQKNSVVTIQIISFVPRKGLK